jgi:hypothetical protein
MEPAVALNARDRVKKVILVLDHQVLNLAYFVMEQGYANSAVVRANNNGFIVI